MLKTIKTHYTKGRIEPVESVSIKDGAELDVTITLTHPTNKLPDATESTPGAWSGLLDCEAFEDDVYANRLLNPSPAVAL